MLPAEVSDGMIKQVSPAQAQSRVLPKGCHEGGHA
jgi:hypothetical protein